MSAHSAKRLGRAVMCSGGSDFGEQKRSRVGAPEGVLVQGSGGPTSPCVAAYSRPRLK